MGIENTPLLHMEIKFPGRTKRRAAFVLANWLKVTTRNTHYNADQNYSIPRVVRQFRHICGNPILCTTYNTNSARAGIMNKSALVRVAHE